MLNTAIRLSSRNTIITPSVQFVAQSTFSSCKADGGDGETRRWGDKEMGGQGDGETRGWGDKEMGRWGDKEMGGQGDGETRRWGDKEMGRQGDGEMELGV
ncbi:MAG: hypothetical protein ACFCUV_08090 [Rivularia sp. (in: cyanobacteria)]